jgi:hypothetical protein
MWIETCNLRTLYRAEAMNEFIKGLDKYKTNIRALQNKLDGQGKEL